MSDDKEGVKVRAIRKGASRLPDLWLLTLELLVWSLDILLQGVDFNYEILARPLSRGCRRP